MSYTIDEVAALEKALAAATRELNEVRENLTRTQERCTQLLEENRALRARDRYVDACLV